VRRHCHHAGGRRLLRRQRRATAAAGPGNPGGTSPKVFSRRPQPALVAAAGLTAIRRRSSGRALPLKLFGALTRRSTATRQRRAPATPGPPRQRHFRGAPGPCRPLRRAWRRAGASAAGTRHWHLDEAREKKRWLRAKITANCNRGLLHCRLVGGGRPARHAGINQCAAVAFHVCRQHGRVRAHEPGRRVADRARGVGRES
jgi:hypothetical protein